MIREYFIWISPTFGLTLYQPTELIWILTHLKLCLASSEWKLFRFDKMEVNDFKILLINVTFYHYHVKKLVFNVLIIKWKKNEYNRDRRLKLKASTKLIWCDPQLQMS